MNRQHKMLRRLGVIVILGLFLTSCGGAKNTTLTIEMGDFKFKPNELTIAAGKEITLNLTNKGANMHEFVIIKLGEHVSVPFDDDDEDKVYWEVELESGESTTVKFTAPSEPGTYDLVCGTPEHIEHGMMGTITVTK